MCIFGLTLCRPTAKSPPQDILLKLEKEKPFGELSQESSNFVFKLGLAKLQSCLLMNGLVYDSSEVLLKLVGTCYYVISYLYMQLLPGFISFPNVAIYG